MFSYPWIAWKCKTTGWLDPTALLLFLEKPSSLNHNNPPDTTVAPHSLVATSWSKLICTWTKQRGREREQEVSPRLIWYACPLLQMNPVWLKPHCVSSPPSFQLPCFFQDLLNHFSANPSFPLVYTHHCGLHVAVETVQTYFFLLLLL